MMPMKRRTIKQAITRILFDFTLQTKSKNQSKNLFQKSLPKINTPNSSKAMQFLPLYEKKEFLSITKKKWKWNKEKNKKDKSNLIMSLDCNSFEIYNWESLEERIKNQESERRKFWSFLIFE